MWGQEMDFSDLGGSVPAIIFYEFMKLHGGH